MIGNNHENDLISLLETLKDTTGSQWVMNIHIYIQEEILNANIFIFLHTLIILYQTLQRCSEIHKLNGLTSFRFFFKK